MSFFLHEQLYRTDAILQKLHQFPITICGAGALGANIAENLVRAGCKTLTIIDKDRIEDHNLSTQPYFKSDIGGFKARILANNLYRAIGVRAMPINKELNKDNVSKLLKNSQLVIDAFDNSGSRGLVRNWCAAKKVPCLHAGMASDYAEVIWNEWYRVPSNRNDDVCDYPLARNLVLLTVAVASESIINFIAKQEKKNYTITIKDLCIQEVGF